MFEIYFIGLGHPTVLLSVFQFLSISVVQSSVFSLFFFETVLCHFKLSVFLVVLRLNSIFSLVFLHFIVDINELKCESKIISIKQRLDIIYAYEKMFFGTVNHQYWSNQELFLRESRLSLRQWFIRLVRAHRMLILEKCTDKWLQFSYKRQGYVY